MYCHAEEIDAFTAVEFIAEGSFTQIDIQNIIFLGQRIEKSCKTSLPASVDADADCMESGVEELTHDAKFVHPVTQNGSPKPQICTCQGMKIANCP